jgi:hypothetical protein
LVSLDWFSKIAGLLCLLVDEDHKKSVSLSCGPLNCAFLKERKQPILAAWIAQKRINFLQLKG